MAHMDARRTLLALVAAVAAFLVVGAAVATYAAPRVEFSVFLGVPAGFAAALLVGVAVFLGLSRTASVARRRGATALAAFGVAFLAVLVGAVAMFSAPNSTALALGSVCGLLAAFATMARGRGGYSSSP